MSTRLPQLDDIHKVILTCKTCGHWKKGPLPQSVINNWLRVHLCAGLHNATDLEIVSESSCPNPCGSPPRGGTDRLETS